MSIARLYDFIPNNTILSAEVDAELNQLVTEVNLMWKKDASENITGNPTILKSTPAVIWSGTEGSAKNWKIVESAGVFQFQRDNSGYASFLEMDHTNDYIKIFKNLVPNAAGLDIGTTALPIRALYIDNGATDGGAIIFDADATAFLKAIAAGTQLQLGDKFTSFTPQTSGLPDLGTTTLRWGKLRLADNYAEGDTPDANTLSANLIPKAWFYALDTGSIQDGVNVTFGSKGGTGIYNYTFNTAMASANYGIVANTTSFSMGLACVFSKSSSGFQIRTSSGGALTDIAHQVIVVGEQ